jgi:hypothetical protein
MRLFLQNLGIRWREWTAEDDTVAASKRRLLMTCDNCDVELPCVRVVVYDEIVLSLCHECRHLKADECDDCVPVAVRA